MLPAVAAQRIADNLAQIRSAIAGAAGQREVTLVCVTKYASQDQVRALLQAGAADLAENLLPQAAERLAQFRAEGFTFNRHLIGPPQSRKIRLIPGNFELVQSVERLKTAELLNEEQADLFPGAQLDVLLQVNIGEEPQKHGFAPAEIIEAAGQVAETCPALRLRGLMAVPPWPDAYPDLREFERGTRRHFERMKELFDKIQALQPGEPHLDTLSLGMSLDYIWAIAAGATMVRVGGALFEGVLEG